MAVKKNPAFEKAAKERARERRQQEKAEQREERRREKAERAGTPTDEGEDPDIAGIVPGPQPPKY